MSKPKEHLMSLYYVEIMVTCHKVPPKYPTAINRFTYSRRYAVMCQSSNSKKAETLALARANQIDPGVGWRIKSTRCSGIWERKDFIMEIY